MAKKKEVGLALVEDYTVSSDGQAQPADYSMLYSWFKKTPELVGIVHAVADDILGESFEVLGSDVDKEACLDWMDQQMFKKKLYSFIQDGLITGNGYFGLSFVRNSDVSSLIDLSLDNAFEKDLGFKHLVYLKVAKRLLVNKQVMGLPRDVLLLRSPNMRIDYDEHGVVRGFVQRVAGESIEFDPSEVIHWSINNLGDSLYGFSPVQASLNDIAILFYAKDYAGKFFENDASPNRIWTLVNESPDSANFKRFVGQLKMSKKKKHSHMVVAGDVKSEKINDFNKDLEFKNLLDEFTQRLMMAWCVPPSRVSHINSTGRETLESNEGYYKKINRMQQELEELLNARLFKLFNVKIKFNRVYKRDESREADIITKLTGTPIMSVNESREMVGLLPVSDPKYDEIPVKQVSGFGGGGKFPTSPELGPEVRQQNQMINPDEGKFAKQDRKVVSWVYFNVIVRSTGKDLDQANTQFQEFSDRLEVFFNDGFSEYKTVVDISGMTPEEVADFKSSFLRNSIPVMIESDRPQVNVQVV